MGCSGSGNYVYYEKTQVEHSNAHELRGRQQALIKDFNCFPILLWKKAGEAMFQSEQLKDTS